MMIIGSTYESKKESIDVYASLVCGCRNPECSEYMGEDTTKPRKSVRGKKGIVK